MKSKIQTKCDQNQLKFDWAIKNCDRSKLKMNLNSLSNNEREITFSNEQRNYKKKLFNSTKEIIENLRFQSSIVTFYIPKLDMLEISYAIQDEATMIIKTTDKKSEIFCLFKVEKIDNKYRLEFLKVDYKLTKVVEKVLKYA